MKIEVKRVVDKYGEWFGIWRDGILKVIKYSESEIMEAIDEVKSYVEPVVSVVAEQGKYRLEMRVGSETEYYLRVNGRLVYNTKDFDKALGEYNRLKDIAEVNQTLITIEL